MILFVVTDGPITFRPETALSASTERFLALFLIGILFAVAYPRRRFLIPLFLCIVIGLFELLQIFVGGRHAHLRDVIVKCVGALAGISIVYVGGWFSRVRDRS